MSTRPWLYAVGGAVVATAAVVTAVALAGGSLTGADEDSGPAAPSGSRSATSAPGEGSATPTTGTEPSPSPTSSGPTSGSPDPEPGDQVVTGIYYVGDTPAGPRLYREFHRVDGDDAGTGAVRQAATAPDDPDYRTLWSPEQVVAGGRDPATGTLFVALADPGLRERPAGTDAREAQMAVQALVYTVQAVTQSRDPVRFLLDDQPMDRVLGVRTRGPVANAPILETLSLVSITSPEEGDAARGALRVTGVANSFEANVVLQLRRPGGGVVTEGYATAEGWMAERLFPFAGSLDLTGVPPGEYVVAASTDDASGGAEGPGAFTDTRRVVVP